MCQALCQLLRTLDGISSSDPSARYALPFLLYRAGNAVRSAICFKPPSCSNGGPSDAKSPWSLGSIPRSLCGFSTKPGMELALFYGYETERPWASPCSRAAQASRREERRASRSAKRPFCLEIAQREHILPSDPSSSVLPRS